MEYWSNEETKPDTPLLQHSPTPAWLDLSTHEVLQTLTPPNQRDLVAANQCFCWQGTRIVIGRHHKSISARAHNREQVPFMHFRHLAIEREKIARFAYRSDDVDLLFLRAHAPALF